MIQEFFYPEENQIKSGGIRLKHTTANHAPEPTRTNHMLLIYTAHGKGILTINGSSLNAAEGDIFLLAPNTDFSLISALPVRELSIYCCMFMPEILPYRFTKYKNYFPELNDFFQGGLPFISLRDTDNKSIRNYMIKMLDDDSYSQPASEYSVKSLLNVVLIDLFRMFCSNQNNKNALHTNMTMGLLINYINQNIYAKITLNGAAQLLHLSPPYLCRFFKKNTNMTFTEFVNKARVAKIKDELENTDRPIFVICDDFEFSPQYINQIFKKYTGYTLAEYKNKFNYKIGSPLFHM